MKAAGEKRENKALFKKLKRLKPAELDRQFKELHYKYEDEIIVYRFNQFKLS